MEQVNKKKWSSMSYEEKQLNILQCIEAAYNTAENSEDFIENIKLGYENDPEWFNFSIDPEDWDNVKAIYETLN